MLLIVVAEVSALGAACTDGVTPDCSDAAAQCGPSLGDASDEEASLVAPPADAASDAADAADEASTED